MARDVGRKPEMEWVPKAFGQRTGFLDGSDSNPVTFTINPMSPRELRKAQGMIELKHTPGGGLNAPNAVKVGNQLLEKHIVSIDNYTNGKHDIVDAETLLKHGDDEIITELLEALPDVTVLEAGDLERLRSRLDGNSQETRPSNGTVSPASGTDSIPSETVHGSAASN